MHQGEVGGGANVRCDVATNVKHFVRVVEFRNKSAKHTNHSIKKIDKKFKIISLPDVAIYLDPSANRI